MRPAIIPLSGWLKSANPGKKIFSNGLATNSVTRPAFLLKVPFTKSASLSSKGCVSRVMVFSGYGSISPSKNINSSLDDVLMPSFIEMPLPRCALVITVAPASAASFAVSSSDESSTTITSFTNGLRKHRLTTLVMVFSSFRAGIITDSIYALLSHSKK